MKFYGMVELNLEYKSTFHIV